jgi:hypothetical protein
MFAAMTPQLLRLHGGFGAQTVVAYATKIEILKDGRMEIWKQNKRNRKRGTLQAGRKKWIIFCKKACK